MLRDPDHCCLCRAADFERLFHYDAPPAGETVFKSADEAKYERSVFRCRACGHCVSIGGVTQDGFYEGGYCRDTYGASGVRAAFERIMSLPPEKSDNVQRVKRIEEFFSGRRSTGRTVVDIGTGLGVFPARMKERGWVCTVLDPDPSACAHARETVGVTAVEGDFRTVSGLGRFELVTLNKVLEHVPDPVAFLGRSSEFVSETGAVYIEIPDGEAAADAGPEREEFFIEHLHIFSAASTALMVQHAGFRLLTLGRLVEPSTKLTLYAFLERGK